MIDGCSRLLNLEFLIIFRRIRLIENTFPVPRLRLDSFPKYFVIKITYIGMYLYLVFRISIVRDVRGRTNSTCVQLHIPSTCVHLYRRQRHTQNLFYTTYVVFRSHILVRFIFQFVLLLHILVSRTNISFCERLNFKPFMCYFVHFTIVILDLV